LGRKISFKALLYIFINGEKSIAFVKVAFPSATWERVIEYLFMNNIG